jgi:hypothetical protein
MSSPLLPLGPVGVEEEVAAAGREAETSKQVCAR